MKSSPHLIVLLLIFSLWGCSLPKQASYESGSTKSSGVVKTMEVVGPSSGNDLSEKQGSDSIERSIAFLIEEGIAEQRRAGHPNYSPRYAFVVDPSRQRMTVVAVTNGKCLLELPVGTGKGGLGFGGSQTPTGFFTMGGVRIARNADASIQTGDSRMGVSGVYAEIVYPPSHPNAKLRGRVPNNVVIHGFNPSASQMLKERHRKKLIGKIPCTTGCPVPRIEDLPRLVPYLKAGAGTFDPSSNPNSTLQALIRRNMVVEYSQGDALGAPILILDRPFRR